MGDAALAASCIPTPGDTNPNRQICGGIYFDNVTTAMTWPGAAFLRNAPTVVNTLYEPVLPVSMPLWGPPAPATSDPPAATANSAASTGHDIGPATLVTPMPTITPLPPDTISDQGMGLGVMCSVSKFAADSPMLAVGVAALVYFLLRGGKR
jgi:hypothetical protein